MEKLDLKDIQNVLLEIMKDVDRVCRANNIIYFASGGTCLGAVRHKGFIPWDDDIDVKIKREDYFRFLEIYEKEKNPMYKIFDFHTNKNAKVTFAKISDTRTRIDYQQTLNTDDLGISVDIFPIDYVSSANYKKTNAQKDLLFKKLHLSQQQPSANYNNKLNKIFDGVKKIARPFFAPKEPIYYLYKLEELATKENNNPNADLAGNLLSQDICDMHDKHVFDSYIDLDFEDMKIMCPVDYDTHLTNNYGDYMTLPKEEDRVAHPADAYWVGEKNA